MARAFAKQAPIAIFDEPSSALDPLAEYELLSGILQLTDGKTRVLISHRLSSVRHAEHVIMLENGCIVEEGTHQMLLDKQEKYAELYRVQERNYCALNAE